MIMNLKNEKENFSYIVGVFHCLLVSYLLLLMTMAISTGGDGLFKKIVVLTTREHCF